MIPKESEIRVTICDKCKTIIQVGEECICEKDLFEEDFEEFGTVLIEEVEKEVDPLNKEKEEADEQT